MLQVEMLLEKLIEFLNVFFQFLFLQIEKPLTDDRELCLVC